MVRMADRPEREEHPVVLGLLALVGVAVVVGVIAGMVAIAGARMVGLDDGDGSASGSQEEASLFLPSPEPTRAADGPLITLAPGKRTEDEQGSEQLDGKSSSARPDQGISLQVASTTVAPMANIDLTGGYPGGEGAILQVQRLESGAWTDFPVTVSVRDEAFATYVQTGQTGLNRFRVVDTDSGKASNVVKVTIGG